MAGKGTVLVVGPHDISRMGIGRILESDVYEVRYTSDGKTAGDLIDDNRESLVLVIVEPGLTKGIDVRPVVEMVHRCGIPLVYATFLDRVLDLDAEKEEVLAFVSMKVRRIEEKK